MQKKWWHEKVAYQIYPKSFYDSNGDGIGDIPGIIEKLDYLADLGVNLVWLSPVYLSPLADQGYDIADYYAIDPRFGTMEDMDRLIAEGKKRGIGIIMDLVVNHCSDEHEWFQKAMKDPDGEYGRFFYLTDAKDGMPCNWRSYFGGPVWEPLPGTDKLYLHLFHKKQPDLNWENPQVREEIYKNINWWLDKGLAGFRIDAIINIKKALPFHDYPADRPDGLSGVWQMLKEADGIGEFLGEMRDRTFAKYDAFTVGEVFNLKPDELENFIGDNGYFSTKFDFSTAVLGASSRGWYDCRPVTPEEYKKTVFASQAKYRDVGFPANIIENHDEPRGASRYLPEDGQNDDGKKMLAALMMMVRGLPFLYQGQEIGMENTVISSIDEVDDVSSHGEYAAALNAGISEEEALASVQRMSRDNARTPMQWSAEKAAGFTAGTPWLKENPNYTRINVASQEGRPDSVLSWYKKLIALRKNPVYKEAVVYGDLIPYLEKQENLMAFYRRTDAQTLLVLANFQSAPQDVLLPGSTFKVLLDSKCGFSVCDGHDRAAKLLPDEMGQGGCTAHLEGYQAAILEVRF